MNLVIIPYFLHAHSHESKVKHVVIESKREPVAGILYYVTPNGPFFSSLYELIEEAKVSALIQNHIFDVKLGKCPPKVSKDFTVAECRL